MSRWPVAGPSEYWILASSPAAKVKNRNKHVVQQIHTRWQQYTQDNYNNSHKTTTTIHTIQLQQYTQDNHNNTHKTTNNNTHKTSQNTTCTNAKQHHGKKVLYTVSSIFPTHILLTISPQPFTSQHFTAHINFSHKVLFVPPSLHFISLHYTFRWSSLHFTSLHLIWFPTHFIFL